MSRSAATASVFHAIADPTRRGLLDLLRSGERSVGELGQPFEMSQPAISQHLRVLRGAGLVEERRSGRLRLYRLNPEPLIEVEDWIGHYRHFWPEKLRALGEYLKLYQKESKRREAAREKRDGGQEK